MSNSTEVEAFEIHQGPRNLKAALLSGAIAGTAVDTVLFPLDTIKTRLQSQAGFMASGGLKGVYSGLLAAVIGSAPSASLFFVTYEASKRVLGASIDPNYAPFIHMVAASCGEVTACTVRVPTEIIKQRMQTKQFNSVSSTVSNVIRTEGILGLYRGFLSTVAREIPFACIQFPLYEFFKKLYFKQYNQEAEPYQAALCGSLAGGIAAAITTPLDVCKTRIMLSNKNQSTKQYTGILSTMKRIVAEEGPRVLLSGIGPRVMWISIGGSIFLGVYEKALKTCTQLRLLEDDRH
ncbi:mitochondrial carrier domain-containing protein [Cunninghamella echinulata]|nr:mitochondrial carrier domain-containing protein [Cunninghamella echinulata]